MEIKCNITPIGYFEKSNIVVGLKGLVIVVLDLNTKKIAKKNRIKREFKDRLISHFSLLSRAARLYPRASKINGDNIFFALKGRLDSYNVIENKLLDICKFKNGMSSPLSFVSFKDGVLFGEYLNNPNKEKVDIVFASNNGTKVVYSLDNIRHIHGLVPCIGKNQFVVFTGDDGEEAGIGLLSINNDKPCFNYVLKGKQEYRGCTGAVFNDVLIYATDSPFIKNSVYSFSLNKNINNFFASVKGSVVYGHSTTQKFYFSSCVESNLKKNLDGSNTIIKTDGINGGILSKTSELSCFDSFNNSIEIIDSGKKDILSIHYFGFGSFLFADSDGDKVVYYSKTLKRKKKRIYII